MVAGAVEAEAELHSASVAETVVPKAPGLYWIFVDHPESLPDPFATYLRSCGTNLLHIGKASTSLFQRLVEQDFRHKRPSTFLDALSVRFSAIDRNRVRSWESGIKATIRFR